MDDLFENITRTEYIISPSGIKIPHSDFDRPNDYYSKMCDRTYTGEEYAEMCAFKDRTIALFDKRWQSARAVIDLIAAELEIDPENCGLNLYALKQVNGEFESPLVNEMRGWFDKSGDKAKLKKRIKELEAQIEALKAVLRGGE
jgi:hypothetical protein